MICRRVVIFVFFSLFILQGATGVQAQDTFGPICDGVTVTCPPDTPTPTTEGAPPATETPPPVGDAAPPPEPPQAGHAETLFLMSGLAMLCIAGGILLHRHATVEG